MPALNVTVDGKKGVIRFSDELITLGRSKNCTVTVADPAVADVHCQIVKDGVRYKIADKGTRSGTVVNGKRMAACYLKHGDVIRVGRLEAVFSTAEQRAEKRPAPSPARPTLHEPSRIKAIERPKLLPLIRSKALPSKIQQKLDRIAFTMDDLAVVVESLIEQEGVKVLDAVADAVDRYHRMHTGASKIQDLRESRENLLKIMEINKHLNSEHELNKLLYAIMDAIIKLTSAERGFLILKEKENMAIKVARNMDMENLQNPETKFSRTIAERVTRTGKPVISENAQEDEALTASVSVENLQLRSLLCVPFRHKDRVTGCLYIDNRFEAGLFIESDVDILQGFADQAAIAIENARQYETIMQQQKDLRKSRDDLALMNKSLNERVEQQTVELRKAQETLQDQRSQLELKYDYQGIIGASEPMSEVLRIVDRVIESDEPAIIVGESGTGKELIARAIHHKGKRRGGPFVELNCAAVTGTLLESELFGHEKGAFTGAVAAKKGLLEAAHGGTLFLDEIGNMSAEMQTKLLRAVELGEFRRVGSTQTLKADIRFVSASNRDLRDLVREGKFREDLFYRLNVVAIVLPPLRERRDDIPLLIDHFLTVIAKELNEPKLLLADGVTELFVNYHWPGNIRELENELRKAAALSDRIVTIDVLKDEMKSREIVRTSINPASGAVLKDVVREAVAEVERRLILGALEETGWKKVETAKMLGISRPTLDVKMVEYGFARPEKA